MAERHVLQGRLRVSEDYYLFATLVPDGRMSHEIDDLPECLLELGLDGKRIRMTIEVLDG